MNSLGEIKFMHTFLAIACLFTFKVYISYIEMKERKEQKLAFSPIYENSFTYIQFIDLFICEKICLK